MDDGIVPSVVVDQADYRQVTERLDALEEKVEFVHAEIAQRAGKRVGRDIGIVYGLSIGTILFLVYLMVKAAFFG
ncbi:tetrahydromethanopterin S-methyltransferase subunit MtrG [Methermicoccus shengliensis]|uniref:Tetrahydromethanopterin S-methyltransferase subunit G n=1 Tax=Methermicoccus shengliensis TaxID=660064 RepID=A0A832RZW6_9EURY|nr:tetrahydromethanopterin S-methyltransferase subunit G [Methermicoccus shengliensis]KUK04042.1 MAG: Tetrahydromethanopterin S-methyltransferase subunit G [Euryarchaeota archaeon 55_53]KUK29710.1 MAG: Tetrahydromethanopterin S-methyltransferase subunit G [Methanosarcinales archeaon 56_1174]MDI3488049.1 tetrahydromethanopterin S-methyltransferase subunit [Methanosarcinales archaeon]MDN5295670.1 tetrahydromethanopterin S-methyltransferase subunit [Methanosarcinales archaeon]HIH70341.1 tetrahydr